MERCIRRRRETPELGRGAFRVLETGAPAVFAHRVDGDQRLLVFVHNLSPEPCPVTVPLGLRRDELEQELVVTDLMHGRDGLRLDRRGRLTMTVAGYGHHWLAVEPPRAQRTP